MTKCNFFSIRYCIFIEMRRIIVFAKTIEIFLPHVVLKIIREMNFPHVPGASRYNANTIDADLFIFYKNLLMTENSKGTQQLLYHWKTCCSMASISKELKMTCLFKRFHSHLRENMFSTDDILFINLDLHVQTIFAF